MAGRGFPGTLGPLIAAAFAIFSDSFLYGLAVPLLSASPAAGDGAQIGLLFVAYAVGVILFTPLFGWFGDRTGRRPTLLLGVSLQAVATLVFALAPSYGWLAVARVLQGGAAAATWTAGLALVAEHYPHDRVQKMGLAMVGMTAGSLVGPLAGGVLVDLGGYQAPFVLAGLLVAADAFLRFTLVPRDHRRPPVANPLPALLRSRDVLVAALVVALIAGGWGVLEPHLPGHLAREFGVSASVVGLLFTISGVAYALVTNAVQRFTERRGLRAALTVGVGGMAVGLPALVLSPNVWIATVVLCLMSAAYAFAMNPILAELADAADRSAPDAYASVYAIFNVAYSLGMIGGDVVTDPLAENVSLLVGFSVLAALLVAMLPVIWRNYVRTAAAALSPAPQPHTNP